MKNKKRYRLLQWYSNSPEWVKLIKDPIAEIDGTNYIVVNEFTSLGSTITNKWELNKGEVENNPDYWQLIEEGVKDNQHPLQLVGEWESPNVPCLIDRVTVKNLGIALRMIGVELDNSLIDKIIDLVELIENKGDGVSIKDTTKLQEEWVKHSRLFNIK